MKTESLEKENLNIQEVLFNIDIANYNYYDELSDELKKQFQPYIVLRWFSSLDDSVQFSVPSSLIENVVGKWSKTGKTTLNELKDEFNKESATGNWISTQKYEHDKLDWRIKFSTENLETAMGIIDTLGITSYEMVNGIEPLMMKYHLKSLNDLVNVNFWEIAKNSEMVYELMCCISYFIGSGEKIIHGYHLLRKKSFNNEIMDIFKSTMSELSSAQFGNDEYKILLSSTDNESFNIMLSEMGYNKEDTKKLSKAYKEERAKHGF